MATYNMGKIVVEPPEINETAEPSVKTIKKEKSKAIKHGYFSIKKRKSWTEMDVTLVQHIVSWKTIENIADLLGMKKSFLYGILVTLREVKGVRNNRELVELALKEGVIKIITKDDHEGYLSIDVVREREAKLIKAAYVGLDNSGRPYKYEEVNLGIYRRAELEELK